MSEKEKQVRWDENPECSKTEQKRLFPKGDGGKVHKHH